MDHVPKCAQMMKHLVVVVVEVVLVGKGKTLNEKRFGSPCAIALFILNEGLHRVSTTKN